MHTYDLFHAYNKVKTLSSADCVIFANNLSIVLTPQYFTFLIIMTIVYSD